MVPGSLLAPMLPGVDMIETSLSVGVALHLRGQLLVSRCEVVCWLYVCKTHAKVRYLAIVKPTES